MPDSLAQDAKTRLSFDHVAIAVPSVGEGVEWYEKKFDATVIDRWDNPAAGMEWAHLAIGDFVLELVQIPRLNAKEAGTYAYHHIAIRVPDCDRMAADLAARGVEVSMPPSDFERHNLRWCFVKDYQGNTIELMSSLSPDRAEDGAGDA
ncbi:VOC family protein [Wenxinia marina]|uniref:Lactoylglutathione lyase n=1 Tax=Wenxinia marina DSM 24838 TaxID=1123501 RepID=A0A0D0NSS3_9RHOB|nr:VOC family protein [Wenxinia marina]KIQ71225.1 Lactoylglutathione lyase [Wenxinia marina DSM 24838]GGL81496.1 hypothetical protein GCM10011392_40150 [Wenxinia marina]